MYPLLSQQVRLGVYSSNCSCPVSDRVCNSQVRELPNGNRLHVHWYWRVG